MARRYGFPVSSITLHFLGGMTAIEGEARQPAPGVLDRRRRPADLARASARSRSALWFVDPGRAAADGRRGPGRRQPARRRAQPGPRAAARRRPGAQGGRLGRHRQRAPRHHRRRLGRPASPRWPCSAGRCCRSRLLGDAARRSSTSCSPSWSRASCGPGRPRRWPPPGCAAGCPHLVARDLARRTLAVPDDLPLAEAVRRAQEAQAGSIVTVTGSGRPVGIVNEAALLATPEDRRPWVPVSTVARTLEDGLSLPAAHHAART